ncbi:unnamed protein product, partial [Brenthis ino]
MHKTSSSEGMPVMDFSTLLLNSDNTLHNNAAIPATAANLIETSQLRRRYYSAQVYAQTQRALSIPVTLILQWDDHSTRPVRVKAQESKTKVGPTRDSNPGPKGVQPYMLATTLSRQLF